MGFAIIFYINLFFSSIEYQSYLNFFYNPNYETVKELLLCDIENKPYIVKDIVKYYFNKGNVKKSEAYINMLLDLNQNNKDLLYLKALLYFWQKRFNESFEIVVKNTNHEDSLILLFILVAKQQRYSNKFIYFLENHLNN